MYLRDKAVGADGSAEELASARRQFNSEAPGVALDWLAVRQCTECGARNINVMNSNSLSRLRA